MLDRTTKRITLAVAAALTASTVAGPAAAQQTTLPALLEEATAHNPRIHAAESAAEAARARVPRAGALPDPTVGVGVMNFPVADPSLGRDRMTMAQLRISERFPWPGKRGLREDVARHRAEAAGWEVERVRTEVLADVKAAYYRIYFLDRALEVTERNERLVADFARLTASKYGVGGAAQPDVLKAQVERTRLADQRVALKERRVGALARLNALLGRPSGAPLPETDLPEEVRLAAVEDGAGDVRFASFSLADVIPRGAEGQEPAIPPVAELQERAFQNNPAVRAHVQRVAAQERAVALAGKAKLPDVAVSVAYSRRSEFDDFVDVMVSVPLPVFAGRKQDREVAEEAATLSEHESRHHSMVDAIDAEIEELAAELRRARGQLVLLSDGILPQAQTSLESATASYRVGDVDFLTLLDAQVTLYQHELDYNRLLADFAENVAKLEKAVGTEVLR